MNCVYVGNFGGADYRWNVEITLGKLRRPNADGFVGETNVQRIPVSVAVNSDRADAKLLAGANYPQCNFASIGNQDFLKHFSRSRVIARARTPVPPQLRFVEARASSAVLTLIIPLAL